jgi:hypothetical protein
MATPAEMVAICEKRLIDAISAAESVSMTDGRQVKERKIAEIRSELAYWQNQANVAANPDQGGLRMIRTSFRSDG